MGQGFSQIFNQANSQNNVDLSSLLKVEKSYVDSIGVVTPGVTSVMVQPIVDDLKAQNTAFENASSTTANILTQQQQMKNILNNEQSRLLQKKQSIEGAITTQQRMIELNESYQKRYAYYTKVVITITIVLIVILGISFLSKLFPVIPTFIISTLYVIVIAVAVIYIIYYLRDIHRRSNMNFDEIRIDNNPLSLSNQGASVATSPTTSLYDLASKYAVCIGPECCSEGTTWDAKNAVCSSNGVNTSTPVQSGFTTISQSSVNPLDGYEFTSYAPAK